MKAVEIIVFKEFVPENFSQRLSEVFGPITHRDGDRYISDSKGVMSQHDVSIFEFAYPRSNEDPIREFVEKLPPNLAAFMEVKVAGARFLVGEELKKQLSAPKLSSTWPSRFDIAIQTVIGKELEAAQDVFHVERKDATAIEGTIYYRGFLDQNGEDRSVVICAQSGAGNSSAALTAERIIRQWSPSAIFLMGICAGRRGKCKIGDVVTPRVIVDDTEGVIEAKRRLRRPKIYTPPHAMIQQLLNFRYDSAREEWLGELAKLTIPPSSGKFTKYVNLTPVRFESAIYSSDLLLRDGQYLEDVAMDLHQQIRIGEMEAAGFSESCNARPTPTPWFIVRGVSDFGDTDKEDSWHSWAAFSAASYLKVMIQHGINFSLF